MQGKEKISLYQFNCMAFGFLLGNSTILSFGINYAQRDTWISELMGVFVGILIATIIFYINKKFQIENIGDFLEYLCGSILAKFLLICFLIYSLIIAASVINTTQTFMNIMIMQETPSWVFIITLAILAGYILRYGLEVVARCSEFFIPIIFILILLLILLALPMMDIHRLTPILAQDIGGVLKAGLVITAFPYTELVLLFFLSDFISSLKKTYFKNYYSIVLGGLILTLRPIITIGVFGVQIAGDLTFPIYSVVRQITISNFFERIGVFFLAIWFFSVFIKLCVCIYITSQCLKNIFRTSDYKIFSYPLALLLIPLSSNLYDTFQTYQIFTNVSFILFSLLFGVLPFVLIFIFSLIKQSNKLSKPS